ncbi:MAG TPA: hypothetical protein VFK50_10375 [Sphingomicrobium sp.]|nr:hypothetical protein [Sphingomicrobium sp.]
MSQGRELQSETHADNDRRWLRHWQEWEVTGREIRSVLCVATGIELRPGMPGFDEGELQKLIAEAQAIMRQGENPMDALRIVPEA